MAISPNKGTRTVKNLIAKGLVEVHEVCLGGRGSQCKFLSITDKGYKAINVEPKSGIGKGAGWEHGFWQYTCAEGLKNIEGVEGVIIEGRLLDKMVDILFTWDFKRYCIEIAMTATHEKENCEKDINAGCTHIFIACRDKDVLSKVEKIVEQLESDVKQRVTLCLVQEVLKKVDDYFMQRRNNG